MLHRICKRSVSLMLALLMVIGLFSGVMLPRAHAGAVEYGNPIAPGEGGGQDLGTVSSKARLTFLRIPAEGVTLTALELNIVKPTGATGFPDLTVGVYAKMADKAAPEGAAIVTGTIPAASIPENTGSPAPVVVDVADTAIVKGDYVVVVTYEGTPDGSKVYKWFFASGFSTNIADANYNTLFNSSDGVAWSGSPQKGYEGYGCGVLARCTVGTAPATPVLDTDFSFYVAPGGAAFSVSNRTERGQRIVFADKTTVNSIDLNIGKSAPPGATNEFLDISLKVYGESGGAPSSTVVMSKNIPAAQVTGGVINVPIGQEFTAGAYYFALSTGYNYNTATEKGYVWPYSSGATGELAVRRLDNTNWELWQDAVQWIKVNHTPEGGAAQVIDKSCVTSLGGYGAGHSGERKRAQVFKPTHTGKLTDVKLMINAMQTNAPTHVLTDLVVEVWECAQDDTQVPTTLLGSMVIPKAAAKVNTADPLAIDFSAQNIQLTSGKYYAVSMTQATEAPDGSGGNEHYRFVTSNHASNPSNSNFKFFKVNEGGNWQAENIGTGWLQVYISEGDDEPDPGDTAYTIDQTFDPATATDSLNVGFAGGFESRYQTFTPAYDCMLNKVSFIVVKKPTTTPDAEPFGDIVIHILPTAAGKKPIGVPLLSLTVPAAQVKDGEPTEITLDTPYPLERGFTYSMHVTPARTYLDYNAASTVNCYAVIRKSETMGGEVAGRANADFSAATTDAAYHLWAKYDCTRTTGGGNTTVVDFSGPSTNMGFGAGHADDEVYRFQTFTAGQTGSISNISVFVNRYYISSQPYVTQIGDLVVSVYATDENGMPTGSPLKTAYVASADLPFTPERGGDGGVVSVDMSCPVTQGVRYAVAISQNPLTANGATSGDYFRWPVNTVTAAAGEKSGKMNGQNQWVDESQLGTYWMKATLTDSVLPPRPRKIEILPTAAVNLPVGNSQQLTARVLDQDNQELPGQPANWTSLDPSVATVTQTGLITAVSAGTTTIRVQSGLVFAIVSVASYASVPNKITGAPNLSLKPGATISLAYDVMDDMKNIRTAERASITYTIDKPAVAKVENGVLTALAAGSTQMAVKAGELVKYVNINVYTDAETLVVPTSGMVITQDVKFKPGVYNLGAEGITIGASNITVDGNGATIVGGGGGDIRYITPPTGEKAFFSGVPASESQYFMRTANQIDLTGATTAELSYKIFYEIENQWDLMAVRVSEDGVNYTSLGTTRTVNTFEGTYEGFSALLPAYTGNSNGWVNETVNLSAYAGKKISVMFLLATDWATEEHGVYIDDFKVTANGVDKFFDGAENGMSNWITNSFIATDSVEHRDVNYAGVGVNANAVDNVTLKNLNVKGFNVGLKVTSAKNWVVEYNDLSNNFTDPSYGWGDGNPWGATNLIRFDNGVIRFNNGNNVWNGLNLNYSNKNKAYNNDFGICSNVPLRMWGSSFNEIYDNCFNWGIRCDPGETHARDSTSSLFEYNTNYNYIARNDFIHGGDGIFIRPLHGAPPVGNYFEGNDTSWANNNAVESWAPGNVYVGNKANYSSYGFWLGGSDFTYLINNQVYNNGGNGGGMKNAPEGFGNAGVSVVNGVSSHFLMMGNDVQKNFGPALAIKYINAQNPAWHWVVQNNKLKNNLNDPRGYKSYGVYTQWAYWVDILSNEIKDNGDIQLKQDGNTGNIRFIGENTAVSTSQMPKLNVTASPAITFDFADKYMADIPQQIKDAEFGMVRIMNVSVEAGQSVTFDAGATDPNGLPLSYRWDFGDNEVEVGATVSKVYTTPGVYRAGVTVSNGQLSNLQGMIVTVVAPGEEIGTDRPSTEWDITGGQGLKVALLGNEPVRRVQGDNAFSIQVSNSTNYQVSYPRSKDLAVDMSAYNTLSFFLDVNVERGLDKNFALPIVRLCKDKDNYINYVPSLFYTAPINMPTSEPRYAYQYLELSLNGSNSAFTRSVVGAVGLNEIKYIEFVLGPQSLNCESAFNIDALKLTKTSGGAAATGNLAVVGSASGIADDYGAGDKQAPITNVDLSNPAALNRYTTAVGHEGFYGVNFLQPRYVDSIETYYYSMPDTDPNVGKPVSVSVEYFDGTTWKQVAGFAGPSAPLANKNAYKFDKVLAEAVRVIPVAAAGKSVGIYAFRAYDGKNILGQDGVKVTSSGSDSVDVTQVSVIVNKKVLAGDDKLPLSDLKVMLYAASGDKIEGNPLATVVVPEGSVNGGAETVVPLTYQGLEPGKRYAVAVSQTNYSRDVGGDIQSHYLFPSRQIGSSEFYGKINGSGAVVPEALGTAFIKVTTNAGVIDFFNGATTASGGFGAGQRDEQTRYQTFTIPENKATLTVDAKIDNANGWTAESQVGVSNWLTYDLGAEKSIGTVNLFLGDTAGGEMPASVKVEYWNGSEWTLFKLQDVTTTRVELTLMQAVAASKLRVTTAAPVGSAIRIREVEAFSDVGALDLTELQALIAQAEALNENVYRADTWTALATALAAAKLVTPASTYEQFQSALTNLKSALTGLVFKITDLKTDTNSSMSLRKGKTFQLEPVWTPSEVETVALSYSSSNPAVASVSVSGLILGIKPGMAIITIRANDGSGKTAQVLVTVTQ